MAEAASVEVKLGDNSSSGLVKQPSTAKRAVYSDNGRSKTTNVIVMLGSLVVVMMLAGMFSMLVNQAGKLDDLKQAVVKTPAPVAAAPKDESAVKEPTIPLGVNVCKGKKPIHSDAAGTDGYFKNVQCMIDSVAQTLEQAGANVTAGYVGGLDATGRTPITDPYWKAGLCPVNVHWHLGAEHLSVGEYDESGKGPVDSAGRKLLAGATTRQGFQCKKYDSKNPIFTKEYAWKHCKDMKVGQTYEVHWPHSAAGACGTPNQYQTPFYDGVFCTDGVITLSPLNTFQKIGVQSQVYTIVNDEDYYYPDMIRGMIVDGEMGKDIAKYTGSTTGTSRSNEVCSKYTPITWQVDRKCHLISASSFDKMCHDMKAQRDDMTDDLHAHGSRMLVAKEFAANNLQK